MKFVAAALAASLVSGCAAGVEDPRVVDGGSPVPEDPQPGPEFDDGLPKIDPCPSLIFEMKDDEGRTYLITVPTLCNRWEDNGVRPPDFNGFPQVEQVAR